MLYSQILCTEGACTIEKQEHQKYISANFNVSKKHQLKKRNHVQMDLLI